MIIKVPLLVLLSLFKLEVRLVSLLISAQKRDLISRTADACLADVESTPVHLAQKKAQAVRFIAAFR